jgi:hypothetical protein
VRRAIGAALVAYGADIWTASARAAGSSVAQGAIRQLTVRSGGRPFLGDRAHFATINPRSSTGRRFAELIVDSNAETDAFFEVVSRHSAGLTVNSRTTTRLRRGVSHIPWRPPASTPPGSYILRLRSAAGDVPGHAPVPPPNGGADALHAAAAGRARRAAGPPHAGALRALPRRRQPPAAASAVSPPPPGSFRPSRQPPKIIFNSRRFFLFG